MAIRSGGGSQVYSAKELRSAKLGSLQGYHTEATIDDNGYVTPDELNAEYDMTNLPDVWLAYVEAVNNGRMDYVVDRLLSKRFKEKYGEMAARMKGFNTTNQITRSKIVNTSIDGDKASLAYTVGFVDDTDLRHKAEGYQDFVREGGEWKVANQFFLYAVEPTW